MSGLSDRCSNDHFDDWWTCPSCYRDLDGVKSDERVTCPNCGARLDLTLELFTSCVSTVVDDEEDGDV